MKAVILAAGKGTRMKALTKRTPKPLLPYKEHTLLDELLMGLVATERFTRFIVVSGYLGDQIVHHVGLDYQGVPVTHVNQAKMRGTYDALLRARPHLDGEKFLIALPDDIQDAQVLAKAALEEHALVAAEAKDPTKFGVIEEKGERVIRVVEKPKEPKSTLVSTGAIVTDTRIFDGRFAPKPEAGKELMLPDAVSAMIRDGISFRVVRTSRWTPIATPEDLMRASLAPSR
jgi:NDP-sugar pyrophosphorylase family protein